MLQQHLQQLGLPPKEAKVYLAGLELGPAPVQEISHKAAVNRATTYFIIEQLQKKGLYSYFYKGKKRYFTAEAPDALKNYLDQQETDLKFKREKIKKLIPELETVYNTASDKPSVKFFEGREGLRVIQNDIMKSKDKTVETLFCLDDVYELFPPSKKDHRHIMIKKGIKIKSIYASKKGLEYRFQDKNIESVQVDANKYPISVDVSFYDNKMAIASSGKKKKEVFGIVLQDKDTVDTLRSVFQLGFEQAKRLQQQKNKG